MSYFFKIAQKGTSRGGKLVKSLEMFSMKNKTIIEFGLCMKFRIMLISEAVIHLGQ